MPRSLHLKSLKLRNFKGIADLDLAFDESLTLLAGVNGAGKTSVIQALLAVVTRALRSKPSLRLSFVRHSRERFAFRGPQVRGRP